MGNTEKQELPFNSRVVESANKLSEYIKDNVENPKEALVGFLILSSEAREKIDDQKRKVGYVCKSGGSAEAVIDALTVFFESNPHIFEEVIRQKMAGMFERIGSRVNAKSAKTAPLEGLENG